MQRRSQRAVAVVLQSPPGKVATKRAREETEDAPAKIPRRNIDVSPNDTKNPRMLPLLSRKTTVSKKMKTADAGCDEDEFGVHAMTVKAIKDMLTAKDLSTNGVKKVISKRLIERLVKEKDVNYKPKPKGRFCKQCVSSLMRKCNGVRGPFFGCTNYPECRYTEGRGYAMVNNKPEPWYQ